MSQSTVNPQKKVLLLALTIALVDQLSKYWMVTKLEGKASVVLLPIGATSEEGWIWLQVTRNSGAAFGFGASLTYLFAVLAILVIVLIYLMLKNFTNTYWLLVLGFMMGGAAGNLIDRVFRAPGAFQGAVVDFIAVRNFSVFNIADSFITIAAIGIVILTLFKIDEKK